MCYFCIRKLNQFILNLNQKGIKKMKNQTLSTKLYKVTNLGLASGMGQKNIHVGTLSELNKIFVFELGAAVNNWDRSKTTMKTINGLINRLNTMIGRYNNIRQLRGDAEYTYYTYEEIN